MKGQNRLIVWLCGLLCLAGCTAPAPETAADGDVWSKDWITVGNVIGVDTPDGMTPQENSDALEAKGMFYATWSIGEAVPYHSVDGEDAKIYDAQAYLLLAGYDDTGKAADAAAEWLSMAESQYTIEDTATQTYNGQAFTVLTYTYTSAENPYARGASAFGVYGNYAVSVELSCQDAFDGSALELLADFLNHCHYAA